MNTKKAGIIASLPEELETFKEVSKDGKWDDADVFFQSSGVGKVSCAIATQKIILKNNPDILFFVGTAGSLSEEIKMGDIAVVTRAIDSEFDARGYQPTLSMGENPFTGERIYKSNEFLSEIALNSPLGFKVHEGYCATESLFMNRPEKESFIANKISDLVIGENEDKIFPNIVDMESSAFMAVCAKYNKPCLVVKTISNNFDSDASEEYEKFRNEGIKNYMSMVAYVLNVLRVKRNEE